jgi:hypothetical protein
VQLDELLRDREAEAESAVVQLASHGPRAVEQILDEPRLSDVSRSITSAARWTISGATSGCFSCQTQPRITLSGVRSSCERAP